jgi:ribosomal 50S subunit-recycling heat shock protein
MSDLLTKARAVAAVKFKWQKDGDAKTYDYFVPEGLELKPGDKVVVETKRGETTVEVAEIKAESEQAEKAILRIAEPEQPAADQPKTDWNF